MPMPSNSDIVIKLDAYREANSLLFKEQFNQLMNLLKSGSGIRIGIAPANRLAEEMLGRLRKDGMPVDNIFVYDKQTDKDFPVIINEYDKSILHDLQKLMIVSPIHYNTIKERFISLGIDKDCIIEPSPAVHNCLSMEDALHYIYSCEDKQNVRDLNARIGEKTLVIVNCPTLFYDVNEKIRIFRDQMGMQIIWISDSMQFEYEEGSGIIRANLSDVINYLRGRRRMDNILYFSVNPVWHLVLLNMIRSAFSEIRIILYIYDWLPLFCPYQHKEILQKFIDVPMEYLESEYKVFEMILDGEVINGLLYKDGGEDLVQDGECRIPKLFFPAYLPERLYREPTTDINNPNRMLYLGKLFSDHDYPKELFSDAFLFNVLDEISRQGYFIDMYYVDSPVQSVNAYRMAFDHNDHVRIIGGKPLDRLLPEIEGKYHWGFLVNNYSDDYRVIRKHVEAALPARIFTFLALGLPVIVSKELSYSAEFVMSNNIGIAVPASSISDIHSIISRVDYAGLVRNVLKTRDELNLDKQNCRFTDFVRFVVRK